jgi:site-specific recombinase XerD
LGWATEGWNAKKASVVSANLKESHATGEGPQTLGEKRQLAQEKKEREEADKIRQSREQLTFRALFVNTYFPHAKANKDFQSYRREQSLFKLWITPVIGDISLKDITGFHLERMKKNMAEADLAARTIRYALAVVRQVFNFARRHNLFHGESPTSKVKMPQADNRRLRFLTHDEADRILSMLEIQSPQVYKMALTILYCGLRPKEVFSLTWGDIDIGKGLMMLRDTKNKKNRIAFMTSAVKEFLAQMIRGNNDDLVFPHPDGKKYTEISRVFERIVKELKLNEGVTDRRQKVVFHSLRHTYASWMVESGVDLYTVKTLLGHSTLAMTERYSHLENGTLQKAVRVFENNLNVPVDATTPLPVTSP